MKHRKLAGCLMAAAMLLMSATGTVFASQGSAGETQDSYKDAPYVMLYTNDDTGKDALKDILNGVETGSPAPDLNALLEILDPETAAVQNEVQEAANSQRSVANQLIQGLRASRSLNETGEPARPAAASGAL